LLKPTYLALHPCLRSTNTARPVVVRTNGGDLGSLRRNSLRNALCAGESPAERRNLRAVG